MLIFLFFPLSLALISLHLNICPSLSLYRMVLYVVGLLSSSHFRLWYNAQQTLGAKNMSIYSKKNNISEKMNQQKLPTNLWKFACLYFNIFHFVYRFVFHTTVSFGGFPLCLFRSFTLFSFLAKSFIYSNREWPKFAKKVIILKLFS